MKEKEVERYCRNIVIERIGLEGQRKLLNAKVLICGAGGLGSSVISSLTSAGIGCIGIVDNDVIELSNLNRQFIHSPEKVGMAKIDSAREWVNSYNPDITINTYNIRLDESNCSDILKQYDVVVDCFDSFRSKFILNDACINTGKNLVHGGVTEFWGQAMTVIPGKSACLRCLFNDYDHAHTLKGVISPVVNIIGSIQAMEVIKILLNFNNLLVNSILSYDSIEQTFRKTDVKANINCSICSQNALA